MSDKTSKLVYSTGQGIPRRERSAAKPLQATTPPAQQKVAIRLDRKRRGGKIATVVEGLQMTREDSEMLLRRLKADLGTGGTVKDTSLEIQGDHREALIRELEKMGYRPKRSGG